MTDLTDAFRQLDPHRAPRGAAEVLAAAQRQAARARLRRRLATGAVAVALVSGAAVVALGDDRTDLETDPGPVATDPTTVATTVPTTTEPAERPESMPTVAVADAGADLLVFGSDGISRAVDGVEQLLWSDPVVMAIPDGGDGVVFQDAVGNGDIRRLGAGDATLLVAGGESLIVLHAVAEVDGVPSVLFTRANHGIDGPRDGEEREERLIARSLAEGSERDLGVTGGIESGLDAVTSSPIGLLASTCHLQCGIRVLNGAPEGDDQVVVQAGWTGGLDASGDLIAYVRSTFDPDDGTTVDPVLVVQRLDGGSVAEVPLPGAINGRLHVDLAPGGGAAVVSAVPYDTLRQRESVLVTGLAGPVPTVVRLDTTQAARFS